MKKTELWCGYFDPKDNTPYMESRRGYEKRTIAATKEHCEDLIFYVQYGHDRDRDRKSDDAAFESLLKDGWHAREVCLITPTELEALSK